MCSYTLSYSNSSLYLQHVVRRSSCIVLTGIKKRFPAVLTYLPIVWLGYVVAWRYILEDVKPSADQEIDTTERITLKRSALVSHEFALENLYSTVDLSFLWKQESMMRYVALHEAADRKIAKHNATERLAMLNFNKKSTQTTHCSCSEHTALQPSHILHTQSRLPLLSSLGLTVPLPFIDP